MPLVEICLRYWYDNDRVTFFYSRKPTAIGVISHDNKRAIDICGEEMPFSELAQIETDIDSTLNSRSDTA